MKIYVVTSGCYSDYHIDAVFTDQDMANAFANIDSDREVEEYEADSANMAVAGIKARIVYDTKHNKITGICTNEYMQDHLFPSRDECDYRGFVAERRLSARTLKDIELHGENSPLLLKIMQDAWAMYKAKHELEEEEEEEERWIPASPEEASKAFKFKTDMYNLMFASTSSDIGGIGNEKD